MRMSTRTEPTRLNQWGGVERRGFPVPVRADMMTKNHYFVFVPDRPSPPRKPVAWPNLPPSEPGHYERLDNRPPVALPDGTLRFPERELTSAHKRHNAAATFSAFVRAVFGRVRHSVRWKTGRKVSSGRKRAALDHVTNLTCRTRRQTVDHSATPKRFSIQPDGSRVIIPNEKFVSNGTAKKYAIHLKMEK